MTHTLAGEVAVVTGGGRGIGRGIAQSLLEAGATVVIAQRSARELEETADELSSYGQVSAHACDVSQRDEVERLFEYTLVEHGKLDILVASHGISLGSPFLELSDDDWDATMAINLRGVFLCGQVAARHMVASNTRGRIILISSICASAAEPNCAHYNASKGGVSALCKSMAFDLAPYGIVTNAIAPGWILATNTERLLTSAQREGTERFSVNPVGRIGLPADIGQAAVWLADPRTSFVSGAVVTIDGAQTAALAYPEAA